MTKSGQRFAAAPIAKQRAGVQAKPIRDSVGTLPAPGALLVQMQDSGIQVLEFNPVNPVNPLALRKGWEVNQRDPPQAAHRRWQDCVSGRLLGGIGTSGVELQRFL